MYKKVKERKVGRQTVYDIYHVNNEDKKLIETIKHTYTVINPYKTLNKLTNSENEQIRVDSQDVLEKLDISQNFDHIIVYNPDHTVNKECYRYFNHHCKHEQLNTRKNRATSICRFLDFCYITSTNFDNFKQDDITVLSDFISGTLGDNNGGNGISYSLIRKLSDAAINNDFKNIRHFLEYLNLTKHPIFNHDTVGYIHFEDLNFEINRFKTTKRYANSPLNPEIITEREYVRLRENLLSKEKDDVFIYISRVMIDTLYHTGMRIGELLGLTNEDIKKGSDLNAEYGEIIVRNRISDQPFQRSKKLLTTDPETSKNTLSQKSYLVYWRKVNIPFWLYSDLSKVSALLRKQLKKNDLLERYKKTCQASKLDSKDGKVYYLFANKKGNCLNSQDWNRWLSDFFYESDIQISKGRGNNLSHRFRHGFAIRMLYIEGLQPAVVSRLLGHKSIYSINQYNRPPEDILLEYQTYLTKKRMNLETEDIREEMRSILWH